MLSKVIPPSFATPSPHLSSSRPRRVDEDRTKIASGTNRLRFGPEVRGAARAATSIRAAAASIVVYLLAVPAATAAPAAVAVAGDQKHDDRGNPHCWSAGTGRTFDRCCSSRRGAAACFGSRNADIATGRSESTASSQRAQAAAAGQSATGQSATPSTQHSFFNPFYNEVKCCFAGKAPIPSRFHLDGADRRGYNNSSTGNGNMHMDLTFGFRGHLDPLRYSAHYGVLNDFTPAEEATVDESDTRFLWNIQRLEPHIFSELPREVVAAQKNFLQSHSAHERGVLHRSSFYRGASRQVWMTTARSRNERKIRYATAREHEQLGGGAAGRVEHRDQSTSTSTSGVEPVVRYEDVREFLEKQFPPPVAGTSINDGRPAAGGAGDTSSGAEAFPSIVNIGTADGVVDDPLTTLSDRASLLVGAERDHKMCRAYSQRFPHAKLLCGAVSLDTVEEELVKVVKDAVRAQQGRGNGGSSGTSLITKISVLKIDIDSFDCALAEKILQLHLRPKFLVMEVNAAIPPPFEFSMPYEPELLANLDGELAAPKVEDVFGRGTGRLVGNKATEVEEQETADVEPRIIANTPLFSCSLSSMVRKFGAFGYGLVYFHYGDAVFQDLNENVDSLGEDEGNSMNLYMERADNVEDDAGVESGLPSRRATAPRKPTLLLDPFYVWHFYPLGFFGFSGAEMRELFYRSQLTDVDVLEAGRSIKRKLLAWGEFSMKASDGEEEEDRERLRALLQQAIKLKVNGTELHP